MASASMFIRVSDSQEHYIRLPVYPVQCRLEVNLGSCITPRYLTTLTVVSLSLEVLEFPVSLA